MNPLLSTIQLMKMAKFTITLCILLFTYGIQGSEISEYSSDQTWIINTVDAFLETIEQKQIEMSIGMCNGANAVATYLQELGIAMGISGKDWEEKVENIAANSVVLNSCKFHWDGQNLTEAAEQVSTTYIACVIGSLISRGMFDQIQDEIEEFKNSLNNVMAEAEACADSDCFRRIRNFIEGDITNTWNLQLSVLIKQHLELNLDTEFVTYCNGIFEILKENGWGYYEDIKQCVNESFATTTA